VICAERDGRHSGEYRVFAKALGEALESLRRKSKRINESNLSTSNLIVCRMPYNASHGVPIWREAQVMDNRQERKHRRFHLEYPVCIKFQGTNSATEVDTITQNVSIGGLLVKSAAIIPEHTPVTFIIRVRGNHAVHAIYLAGEGKIVRIENSQDDATFSIAVECRAPIMQLEEYLPPA